MQFKEIDEISSIQTGEVNYYSEGRPCFGYIAHDKNREGKLPVVIIVHAFISYPDAKHAYTNPEATVLGQKFNMPIAYNAEADSDSWEDMTSFFHNVLQ